MGRLQHLLGLVELVDLWPGCHGVHPCISAAMLVSHAHSFLTHVCTHIWAYCSLVVCLCVRARACMCMRECLVCVYGCVFVCVRVTEITHLHKAIVLGQMKQIVNTYFLHLCIHVQMHMQPQAHRIYDEK